VAWAWDSPTVDPESTAVYSPFGVSLEAKFTDGRLVKISWNG
jgi:hypothetical protein